jgi:hypothetical protein
MTLAPVARAAVIGTDTLLSARPAAVTDQLQAALERDDVRTRLIALGVNPDQARKRVAALTPDEIARLQGRIDSLPAGAGALEVIGVVFLVLLILELVGVTNIFHRL